jgi:hypothetical protein
MNKELSELTLIRLQTELENAIGFREHYLQTDNYFQYHVWDLEMEQILEQIMELDK